ncbi:MAG TPA: prenyltransferase/squalene oxidase repeat-containing protein [Planctomycetaceae bacterium]|nr:prenyltransferase/squalene oxidase repeat-containing protein [Planctomycetaceae bacterium]
MKGRVALCGLVAAMVGLAFALPVAELPAKQAEQPPEQADLVDRSVSSALQFLAHSQNPSGSWNASFGESKAATSLAVMAFLAAGYVPGEGPYSQEIERGVNWLLSQQDGDGSFGDRNVQGPMYSHGISTLMLAEILGMTPEAESERVRRGLEKGVRLILKAQDVRKGQRDEGGWRYHANSSDSDLSVTGWQLLALRAAKNVGCDVPAENIDKAVAYVKRCSTRDNHGFCYQPGDGPTSVRSGTGILALEICGEHHSAEALGAADYVLEHPLNERQAFFFYGAYYCAVGMFQIGGRHWEGTRDHLTRVLTTTQRADGGWDVMDGAEQVGGRIYATSMAVLALAVEYQYLPIYQH